MHIIMNDIASLHFLNEAKNSETCKSLLSGASQVLKIFIFDNINY
jgi:hypothetical protein